MKTCSSIRYGGLLVDAKDCDYTSFKHLGLVCPICHRSVFLCSGSERKPHERKLKDGSKTQVKESKVDAYFAHHPEVDKAIVNDCEMRSAQITKVQREAIAAKARNQRSKILQAHFWKIVNSSPAMERYDTYLMILRNVWDRVCVYSKLRKEKEYQLLIEAVALDFRRKANAGEVKEHLREWKESTFLESVGAKVYDDMPDHQVEYYERFYSGIDLAMHKDITSEAVLFVSTKMQSPILYKLAEYSIARLIIKMVQKKGLNVNEDWLDDFAEITREIIGLDQSTFSIFKGEAAWQLACLINSVNWAEQFEKLQEQEVVRNLAIA